jgi:hypothetical protein
MKGRSAGGEPLWRGHKDLAPSFTVRLPPKEVLNKRLPGITQRDVFPKASVLKRSLTHA